MVAKECITLNESEQKIFDLLRDCCETLNLKVTLRVAGGWVRDKLLGLECHDCDIAIDRMMGQTFAERLRDFLMKKSVPTSAFGVIQANPDRSKHLETATLTVYGYPIDFVNLRAESYSVESRIPMIKFGTPLEDALRRDITINALFYNIHTEEVEDFCGTGFEDLENRIIRTPLDPKETLLDDPLRLLRVIRFATRFQFRIELNLMAVISDDQVDNAFRSKISRERVGIELDKILRDKYAYEGILMLKQLKVFNLIFDIPEEVWRNRLVKLPSSDVIGTILNAYKRLVDVTKDNSNVDRRLSLLCHCLLPHAGVLIDTTKGRRESLVSMIVRDSLKFTNQTINDASQLLGQVETLMTLVLQKDNTRVQIGKMVRSLGKHWEIAFHLAAVQSILSRALDEDNAIRLFLEASRNVYDLFLNDAWEWRSILNGKDIQELLNIREGRLIGMVMATLFEWQYENPRGSRQEAIEHILSKNWPE